jgi:ComEC/Rec2-related protein
MDNLRCFIERCKDFCVLLLGWQISPYGVILWLPVGLGLGILTFFALPSDPELIHVALAGGAFATGVVTLTILRKPAGWPLMLLLVGAGFSLATFKAHVICGQHQMLQTPLTHHWCEGVVLETEATTKGYRYVVEVAQSGTVIARSPATRQSQAQCHSREGGNTSSLPRSFASTCVLRRFNLSERENELIVRPIKSGTPAYAGVTKEGGGVHLNKVRVSSLSRQEGVQVGDKVRFLGTLLPLSGPVVPNGYDFRRQAYFQGLNAVGFLEGRLRVLGHEKGVRHHINSLRAMIRQKIQIHLQGSVGAIATALITGERAPISNEVNSAFNDSGLAHILSISGLHFSILAGLVFFTCRRLLSLVPPLANRYDLKKVAAWVVIAISLFYALIAGGSVPVVRSFIMILAAMVAVLMDRDPISMRLVALAATCILVISPEALLTASFQMSFAAVIGLVAFYEYWQAGDHKAHSKIWVLLTSTMLTTVVASLATAPFTLYHFGRVTLYAVLANALAVPLTAFWIMPCILLLMILMPFGFEGWICEFLGYGLKGLILIAEQVAQLPYSTVVIPPLPSIHALGFIGMTVVGGLLLCLGPVRWRKASIGMVLAAGLWLLGAQPYDALLQKEPFALMIRTQQGATCVGKAQPFLLDQWAKALGLTPTDVACIPLCDQPGRHRQSQMCVRTGPETPEGMNVLGVQLVKDEKGEWQVNGRALGLAPIHGFRWDSADRLTPIPWPMSQRRWAR